MCDACISVQMENKELSEDEENTLLGQRTISRRRIATAAKVIPKVLDKAAMFVESSRSLSGMVLF